MPSYQRVINQVIDTVLLMRFRLSREIVGEGAYGVVIGGIDLLSMKPVVVKFSKFLSSTNVEY